MNHESPTPNESKPTAQPQDMSGKGEDDWNRVYNIAMELKQLSEVRPAGLDPYEREGFTIIDHPTGFCSHVNCYKCRKTEDAMREQEPQPEQPQSELGVGASKVEGREWPITREERELIHEALEWEEDPTLSGEPPLSMSRAADAVRKQYAEQLRYCMSPFTIPQTPQPSQS